MLCPRDVKADGHCPQRALGTREANCKKCGKCKDAKIEIHMWEPGRVALESHPTVGGSDSERC